MQSVELDVIFPAAKLTDLLSYIDLGVILPGSGHVRLGKEETRCVT
jgi:hypothetical protein